MLHGGQADHLGIELSVPFCLCGRIGYRYGSYDIIYEATYIYIYIYIQPNIHTYIYIYITPRAPGMVGSTRRVIAWLQSAGIQSDHPSFQNLIHSERVRAMALNEGSH